MNQPIPVLDLTRIYDDKALPYPFIPQDKTVILQTFEVEEQYHTIEDDGSNEEAKPGQPSTVKKGLIVGTPDYNSSKTVRAKVVAVPNYARNHFAGGFALGDVVMIHEKVGNKIYLAGHQFQIVRAEDIIGWYELSEKPTITMASIIGETNAL